MADDDERPVFRPGGSALNSCQVGSLRAAQHIAYDADNGVSQNYEAILAGAIAEEESFLESTRGDKSTVIEKRLEYQRRMSKSFAFLRSIPDMRVGACEISAAAEAFCGENKWKLAIDIPHLYKNLDIVKMQKIISESILYTAENFGSRGSAFVTDGGDVMDRVPMPENADGRGYAIVADNLGIRSVAVRPIPERELWFERAWNKYNERTSRRKA